MKYLSLFILFGGFCVSSVASQEPGNKDNMDKEKGEIDGGQQEKIRRGSLKHQFLQGIASSESAVMFEVPKRGKTKVLEILIDRDNKDQDYDDYDFGPELPGRGPCKVLWLTYTESDGQRVVAFSVFFEDKTYLGRERGDFIECSYDEIKKYLKTLDKQDD
jgi:hypothetical protein